jgi:hypothetical protein
MGVPTFFLKPTLQDWAMSHELGRYFGGITEQDEMDDFDQALYQLEREYNWTHRARL